MLIQDSINPEDRFEIAKQNILTHLIFSAMLKFQASSIRDIPKGVER